MQNTLDKEIRDLFPGSFALVMATGIVAIAAYLLDMKTIAWPLFRVSEGAYAVLWLMILARAVRYFPKIMADLGNPVRGPGFLTMVAGTCILGNEFVILDKNDTPARLLWYLGIALWLVLIYGFLTLMIVRETKASLESSINGGWLIAVVATQSVVVLGTLVAPSFSTGQDEIRFFGLSVYLFGGMLYILIIALIFYRLVFFKLAAEELTPLYWINMGALAITTLAGSRLILSAPQWPFLQELVPFLKGFTLFFWATGTWWIPLLVILGVWRHLVKRYPLTYSPAYWGMVFPLGMYTVGTFQLAKATQLSFLEEISRYFVYVALLAWLLTFLGLLRRMVGSALPAIGASRLVRSHPERPSDS